MVAYDDLSAGQRAIHLLDELIQRFDYRIELTIRPWSFALINSPEGRALADAEELAADILVISTTSETAIPRTVEAWIRQCLSVSHRKKVMVVALPGTANNINEANSTLLEALKRLADEAGEDFSAPVLHAGLSLDKVIANLHGHANLQAENTSPHGLHLPITSANPIDPVQHWGLNE